MKRLLVTGAAALTLCLGAASCGSVDPDAVVVNGTRTSVRDFEQVLGTLAKAQTGAAASTTLPAERARQVLGNIVVFELFHAEFAKRGLTVDAAAIEEAKNVAPQVFATDATAWATLPDSTRAVWTTKTTEFLTVQKALAGPVPSEAAIVAFYEENKDQIGDATLDDVRSQIVDELQGREYVVGLRKVLASATVKINPRYGVWDSGKGVVPVEVPVSAR